MIYFVYEKHELSPKQNQIFILFVYFIFVFVLCVSNQNATVWKYEANTVKQYKQEKKETILFFYFQNKKYFVDLRRFYPQSLMFKIAKEFRLCYLLFSNKIVLINI